MWKSSFFIEWHISIILHLVVNCLTITLVTNGLWVAGRVSKSQLLMFFQLISYSTAEVRNEPQCNWPYNLSRRPPHTTSVPLSQSGGGNLLLDQGINCLRKNNFFESIKLYSKQAFWNTQEIMKINIYFTPHLSPG